MQKIEVSVRVATVFEYVWRCPTCQTNAFMLKHNPTYPFVECAVCGKTLIRDGQGSYELAAWPAPRGARGR